METPAAFEAADEQVLDACGVGGHGFFFGDGCTRIFWDTDAHGFIGCTRILNEPSAAPAVLFWGHGCTRIFWTRMHTDLTDAHGFLIQIQVLLIRVHPCNPWLKNKPWPQGF